MEQKLDGGHQANVEEHEARGAYLLSERLLDHQSLLKARQARLIDALGTL